MKSLIKSKKSSARKRPKQSKKSSTHKRPKQSKKSGKKLKRNYRLHSRVSPNDDHFSKSAIDYFTKRDIEHAKVMNILGKRSTNIKKLLWVRHCESCSNVSSILSKNKYDEPLCTRKGIGQALTAGDLISGFQPEHIGSTIFSSFLPRAIETALLIAISFNLNRNLKNNIYNNYLKRPNKQEKIIKKIKIIDNISEHLQLTDTNPYRINKLSQSKTSYNSANTYITKIIDLIQNNDEYKEYVPSIEWISEDCTKAKLCNLCHSKKKNDIQSFLSSNFNIFENNKFNIIVSHGGFIRKNICKNLEKFGNCEVGLTELNKDGTLTDCVSVLDKNDVVEPKSKYLDPSNPLYLDLKKYGDCTFDRVKLSSCKLNRS
jgi:broad specificity phosphatase PhoE